MKVYKELSLFENKSSLVVTVGSFDGLHIGHQKIIEEVIKTAGKKNIESCVITFEPHPRMVLQKEAGIKLLTSLDEKIEILESIGVNKLVVLNFSIDFSHKSSEQFIEEYVLKLGAVHMVVGHDHKFGKDRLGDVNQLMEIAANDSFGITEVQPETFNGEIVSSSKIRTALLNGDIEKANDYLGRNYSVSGIITLGAQRGRTLGFPTANLKSAFENKVLPKNGVYIVDCIVDGQNYFGIMNIGNRPTFESKNEIVIEVNLFDFDGDIYGQQMKINFLHRVRDEKKFQSKEELIQQINSDKIYAAEFLKKFNK
ncbi:MAG: bifunctional riboflavin kinase/FAD synthetase [Melioribacteraceae bacterium]|nr:bifunctional riboflavin kinase/FAD synthetase [Melioribacteraceae bacterium]